MKAWRITIFLFSVLLMLGVLCAFFPKEGVELGPVELRFASLEDFLPAEPADTLEEPQESPEELLARRVMELRQAEESEFLDYFEHSDARIQFPGDDLSLFDPFFRALDSASVHPLRILHYGDSQIEEDRISNNIRKSFQARFGGNGIGLMPLVQSYPTLTSSQRRSSTPRRALIYGTKDFTVQNGSWGINGQVARLDGPVSVTYYPARKLDSCSTQRRYSRVTILTDTLKAPMTIKVGGIMAEPDTLHRPLRRYVAELPALSEGLSIDISGRGDVFGIMFDAPTGVSVDNAAMRGCSGTIFTKMDPGQLRDYVESFNVKLIILQFGGNATPYLNSRKARENYAAKLETQMRLLRSLAPEACYLFIGPSDMATNVNGSMQTYPHLPDVIDILRETAHKCGVAYWDLYSVMGGRNSMVKWVRSTPPLAGADYIHFTHRGADRTGDFLSESLMLYYDYYRWRNKPLDQQIKEALKGE